MPAPTLYTSKLVAVGVGLVSMLGAAPSARDPDAVVLAPARATLSMPASDYFPTVVVVQGPYAAPDRQALALAGRVPFMQGSRTIAPALPDTVPVDNDLTPTLIWGAALQPGVGEIWWRGTGGALAPSLITDGSQIIYPEPYPAVVVQGLAPTLQIPISEQNSKAPRAGLVDVRGLAPTLQTEVTLIAPTAMTMMEWLVIQGHPPGLVVRYGWTTVALSGDAVWTDVVSI